MTPRRYTSPIAFKQALEQRLRDASEGGIDHARRDVAFADPMLGDPARIVGPDLLGFAGVAPPTLPVYPIETHIAEKLHAYTMPRSRPNSRVKDLPDMALLASAQALDARRLRAALEQTFAFRDTHPLPSRLPAPAASWEASYAAMASEDRLAWSTLAAVTTAAQAFLDPVLAGGLAASWDPARWSW